jgi:hypothetical protein
MTLANFDFSELLHYVDGLLEARSDEDRAEWLRALGRIVPTLPHPPRAAALIRTAAAFASGAGNHAEVLREFAELADGAAGWSAAQWIERDRRRVAAEHGRKGGRPSKAERNRKIAGRYAELLAVRRGVADDELYEDVGAEFNLTGSEVRDIVAAQS